MKARPQHKLISCGSFCFAKSTEEHQSGGGGLCFLGAPVNEVWCWGPRRCSMLKSLIFSFYPFPSMDLIQGHIPKDVRYLFANDYIDDDVVIKMKTTGKQQHCWSQLIQALLLTFWLWQCWRISEGRGCEQ